MIALLTRQGTAMSETALCSAHSNLEFKRAMLEIARQQGDYDPGTPFVGVDNPELSCQVCGKQESAPALRDVFARTIRRTYKAVGETSSDFRTDYAQATEDLKTLAAALGLEFFTPDYVTEIINPEED